MGASGTKRLFLALSALICIGCGSFASLDELNDDGVDDGVFDGGVAAHDGAPPPPTDADIVPADAAPDAGGIEADGGGGANGNVVLSHNISMNLTYNNTPLCFVATPAYHRENRYFRVFRLTDFDVQGPFNIEKLVFGVESAISIADQLIQVRVHRLTGLPKLANLEVLTSKIVGVANGTTKELVNVDLTPTVVPAGTTLVAEIYLPDGQATGSFLRIGANVDGQTAPGYIATSPCAVTEMTDLDTYSGPDIILTVEGTAL